MNPKADPKDYTYDIPVEDLRRYKALAPAIILQWLEDAQTFMAEIVRPNLGTRSYTETAKPVFTFDQLEAKLRDRAKQLRRDFAVSSLAVFGSVARGEARPDSDVDFLVQFEGTPTFDQYMNLKIFLEDLLDCPVDLVTQDGVRPQTRSFIEGDARRVA